jgi:beta-mannosidase
VHATTSEDCCSKCRAEPTCLGSVLSPATSTCTLHNVTGLELRIHRAGSYACYPGPASNAAVSVPAAIPGDHLTDLQSAGLIDDPLFDLNFQNATVWGGRTWSYTATFTPPASLLSNPDATVLLVFDGVKMGANVSLNGHAVGLVKDQFLRYSYDVTSALVAGKSNTLTLVFDLEIFVNGRFMACSGGWDWAPYATTYNRWGTKVFSLGVWKDVYLVPVAATTAAVTHVVPAVTYTGEYPVEPLTDATAAPFNVDVTVHTWAVKATTATLTATGEWDSTATASATVDIPAGEATVGPIRLTAHDVKLWWPNGFGEQPRYNVSVDLAFGTSGGSVGTARRIGFRYAVLVTGNDTDPVYVKAAATQEGSSPHGSMTTFIFRGTFATRVTFGPSTCSHLVPSCHRLLLTPTLDPTSFSL